MSTGFRCPLWFCPTTLVLQFLLTATGEAPYCPEGRPITPRDWEHPRMFEDLTPREMKAVRDFLLADPELNLQPYDSATLDSSYIYLIDLRLPKKSEALDYLDKSLEEPERGALVILYCGDMDPPRVEEYQVGPLPNPTYWKQADDSSFRRLPIPFNSRPVDMLEFGLLYRMIDEVAKRLDPVIAESYGLRYHNCSRDELDCLVFSDISPRGIRSNERRSWFWSFRTPEGYFLHPLGLELQVDHNSVDPKDWFITKVVYNGQMFPSVDEFLDRYMNNDLKKIRLTMTREEAMYSSFQRRGPQEYDVPARGPQFVEPDGRRYSVDGQHVRYFGWEMDFRLRSSTGIQLFDIRFRGERIIYELSLQDAVVFYTGYGPTGGAAEFYDTSVLMGACMFELMPGVDCPSTASYHDIYHFASEHEPTLYKNAVCVFEQNGAIPLRRHYGNNYKGGYDFYGGSVDNSLVVRSIANIGNYDYIFDHIFHLNGAIEIKASLTGYVQASFALPEEVQYGNYISDYVVATLHHHLFNYKVDFDIAGTSNRYATLDISTERVPVPWNDGLLKTKMKFTKVDKLTERESVETSDKPSYHIIYNNDAENRYGTKRGYRVDSRAQTTFVLEGADGTQAASWAKYPLSVTRFHDSEGTSSSIYAQDDPFDPVLDFDTYLADNESITDEDLVVWLTAGALHIPDAEDVPVTTTAGGQYNIYLRPFNFLDEDPSMVVSDSVHAVPRSNYRETVIDTFGTREGTTCLPNETPHSVFHGNRPEV